MPAVTVAMLGGEPALRLAGELGKGSVEGDVGRHFFKRDDHAVNFLTPSRYPERVQGVSQALLVADHVFLLAEKMDRDLGMLILAAAASGVPEGHLVVMGGLSGEELQPLVQDTPLASWPVLSGAEAQPALLRDRLGDLPPSKRTGPTRVAVEQAFAVKGVGTVVLGVVTQGRVARHQVLEIHPAGLSATVRSIQVHDDDVKEAGSGERVGLALRGVEAEALSRGHVLAEAAGAASQPPGEALTLEVEVPRFHAPGIRSGRTYHMGLGLQFVPVETGAEAVAAGEGGTVQVTSTSPLAIGSQRVLLWDLEHPALRLVAGGRIVPSGGQEEGEGA